LPTIRRSACRRLSGRSNASGTLTVSAGGNAANLTLLGKYTAANFTSASDGNGGTLIADPPPEQHALLTQPQHG